jgi:hypothetical protein
MSYDLYLLKRHEIGTAACERLEESEDRESGPSGKP